MSQPQTKEQEQTVASAPLEESERQELLGVINEAEPSDSAVAAGQAH